MTLEEILAALDNLAALSLAELETLRDAIAATYAEMREEEITDEIRAALRELVDAKATVAQAIEAKQAEAAAAEQELADLDAAMSDDDGEGEDGEEGDGDDAEGAEGTEGEGTEEGPGDGDGSDEGAEGADGDDGGEGAEANGERVLVNASGTPAPPTRPSLRRMRGQQRPARSNARPVFGADVVTAAADVPEIGGQRITTGERFMLAMTGKAEQVAGTMPRDGWEKFSAVTVRHAFDADLTIGPRDSAERATEVFENATKKFLAQIGEQVDGMGDDVRLAAGGPCIPAEPDFTVEFIGGDHRPFSQAFPTVNMPRSRVSFYGPIAFDRDGCDAAIGRSITIAQDIAGYGNGQGQTAPKSCVRIDCPEEPDTCQLDIMLKCVTIGNWVDRTWPEWVKVFNQNVDACYSVAYETKHMGQVIAGSTLLTAGPATFGAIVDFLGQILTLKARVQNGRRLAASTQWRLIVPEWFVTQLRIDVMRYMGLSEGGFANLRISDATIIGWLRAEGINVSTYVDEAGPTAQGDDQVLTLPTAGPLLTLPGTVRTFFFPEGTWVRGTGGTLDLGVVRDSALNSVNDFQTFMEEWTSMCKRGLDSYVVDHVLCPSGLIGGTVALECAS